MGPSKTESLSGYRLGVAFGAAHLVDRMEKLQAIVSLRAPGYSQAVLRGWFEEPPGWLAERTAKHQAIRDDLVRIFRSVPGLAIRTPEAGSYLFPRLPSSRCRRTTSCVRYACRRRSRSRRARSSARIPPTAFDSTSRRTTRRR